MDEIENLTPRIDYPAAWSQASRDELDAMFDEARAKNLWFFHGGMSGPLWFHPDDLEEQQRKGHFVWGAPNWRLRDPREHLAEIDCAIAQAKEQQDKIRALMTGRRQQ